MRGWRPVARVLRGAVWGVAVLVAVTLLVAVGVPLVVRGPVLVRLVERVTRDRCGSVKLDGGHVSLGLAPALLFERPFEIDLRGAHVREPDGNDLFRARVVRVKLAVLRHPFRVVVERMFVGDGAWRLADTGFGLPLTEALRKIPPGGRGECDAGEPAAGEPTAAAPTAAAPSRTGPLLTIRAIRLENVSLGLSFPDWALALGSVDARGTVEVRRAGEGLQILFDARDIRAKDGGSLRVGAAGARLTPEIPFERVAITRVAVTAAAPGDLQLEVAEGRTAGAVLSGRAVFTNLLTPGDQHPPVGMELDARWAEVGQALARSEAWAAVGERLAELHAGLQASLHGDFHALTGSATLAGRGVRARARLLPGQRYTLDLDFERFDTSPLVPRAHRELLGGRLDGRVSVSARLGDRAAGPLLSLDTIELSLLRSHANGSEPTPRRWVVSRAIRPRAPDELRVGLGVVALDGGALHVDSFRAEGPAVVLLGRLQGQREPGSSVLRLRVWTEPGSRVSLDGELFLPPPLLAARIDFRRGLDVEPFSVEHVGGGTIDAGGSARPDGPSDLWAEVRGYPLAHVPGLAGVQAPGRRASVADLLRGRLDASLRVAGHAYRPSLSGVVTVSDVRWAGHAAGNGRVVLWGVPDGTRFGGQLVDGVSVRGVLRQHPHAQDFAAITVRDLPLGPWLPGVAAALAVRASGEIVWRPGRGDTGASTTANLALRGPGIDLDGSARLDAGRAAVKAKGHLALGQMRAAFPALHLRQAAGVIAVDLSADAATGSEKPRAEGTIAIVERLALWPVGWGAAIFVPPSQVELRGDDLRVPSLAVFSGGAQAALSGALHLDRDALAASQLAVSIRVRVAGGGLGPWLPGRPRGGSGTAGFDGQLAGSIGQPHLRGRAWFQGLTLDWPDSPVGAVRLDGPVAVDGRTLTVGPLSARSAGGGWIQIGGPGGSGRLVIASPRGPLPTSDLDLTVRGAGLTTTRPLAGVSVRDLALGVRLTQANQGVVRVVGQVNLGHDRFELAKRPKSEPGKPASNPSFVDHIWVNLRLVGPEDTLTLDVPWAPDVTVGARCLVVGPLASPRITGELTGAGLYSRAVLTVGDWFTERDLHKCDLGPR